MAAMHNAVTAARSSNLSQTYLRKMLAHHEGAVAISDDARQNGVSGAGKALAEKAEQLQQSKTVRAMLAGELMHRAMAGTNFARH
ncbi:MAG: DUF305 domain-containing protein [Pseudomonadota bacterium]